MPPSRLRTLVVATYFRQIVAWMMSRDYAALMPHVALDATVQVFALETFRGRSGWERGLGSFVDSFAGLPLVMEEWVDPGDDQVLCIGRARAEGVASGVPVERDLAFQLRVERGMATYARLYETKDEALEAVGLSE